MTLLMGPAYPAALAAALGLTRQNVSNHLACLRDCGIVVVEPEGRQVRYEISDPHLTRALSELVEVVLTVDAAADCLVAGCTVPGCGTPDSTVPGCGAPDNTTPGRGAPDSTTPGRGAPRP